jgi:hypothetical protein
MWNIYPRLRNIYCARAESVKQARKIRLFKQTDVTQAYVTQAGV